MADDRDRLLEHDYDGIHEYDNPMPRWWVYVFWATIVFAVVYTVNVGPVGVGKGRIAEYDADVAAARAKYVAASGPTLDVATLAKLSGDPATLAKGKVLFASNCAACHRADGGGMIGPNLTDDYWLHGGTLPEIYTTVTNGVPAKGMPTWGKVLKPDQVASAAVYVYSLHGSNPSTPKPPQGVLIKR